MLAVAKDQRVFVLALNALILAVVLGAVSDSFLAESVDSEVAVRAVRACVAIVNQTAH